MSNLIVSANSGSTVNLRKEPSTSSTILQPVPIGKEVELIEKTNDTWYKVKYKNIEGYMMTKFLKVSTSQIITKDDLRKIYDSLSETLKLLETILK